MADSVAGVVLAAGAGTRLRPLTLLLPKPLCPVLNRPLVDWALDRLTALTPSVAVNVHHGRDALVAHLRDRAHVSIEEREALGTAGALALLRPWIDGRPVVVVNADTWCATDAAAFLDGWDGIRPRVLVGGSGAFGSGAPIAGAVFPWTVVEALEPVPSGLYQRVWVPAAAAGELEVVPVTGPCLDCGTPRSYLEANLLASGGQSVIGPGADVRGEVVESVVWPGASVAAGERLVRAIRAGPRLTVLVR